MEKPSKIAANLAAAAVVASLFGMSAFADSRHRDETNRSGRAEQSQERTRREGRADQPSSQQSRIDRHFEQRAENPAPNTSRSFERDTRRGQNWDRSRGAESDRRSYDVNGQRDGANRGYSQRNDSRGYEGQRGSANNDRGYTQHDNRGYTQHDNRGYTQHDNRGYGNYGYGRGHDSHHSITMEGRVTRIMHEHDGYRVWLDHGGYSYWVPSVRFNLWPLHVGLNIRLGGWWDPMGYVNVYDMGPVGGPYYTSGDLRGIVESVDYRRGTAVIRDDLSGSFVTVLLRGNDPRLGSLRPGDYIDLSGAWSRGGYFEAYNLVAAGGDRNGYGYGY